MKKFLALVAALLLLVSCSSKPNDDQTKAALEKEFVQLGFNNTYEVKEFHKNNGFEKDEKTYIADVTYVVAAREGKAVNMNDLNEATKFFGRFVIAKGMRVTEKITLIKTDKGWEVSEIKDIKLDFFNEKAGQWQPIR